MNHSSARFLFTYQYIDKFSLQSFMECNQKYVSEHCVFEQLCNKVKSYKKYRIGLYTLDPMREMMSSCTCFHVFSVLSTTPPSTRQRFSNVAIRFEGKKNTQQLVGSSVHHHALFFFFFLSLCLVFLALSPVVLGWPVHFSCEILQMNRLW